MYELSLSLLGNSYVSARQSFVLVRNWSPRAWVWWVWHRIFSFSVINSCKDRTCFSPLREQRWSQLSDALSIIHFRRHGDRSEVLTGILCWAKLVLLDAGFTGVVSVLLISTAVGLITCKRTLDGQAATAGVLLVDVHRVIVEREVAALEDREQVRNVESAVATTKMACDGTSRTQWRTTVFQEHRLQVSTCPGAHSKKCRVCSATVRDASFTDFGGCSNTTNTRWQPILRWDETRLWERLSRRRKSNSTQHCTHYTTQFPVNSHSLSLFLSKVRKTPGE